MSSNTYQESILKLRREEDERVAAEALDWFNLIGLFRLEEGPNSIGNDEENKIFLKQFPSSFCGNLILKNGVVTFEVAEDLVFTSNHPDVDTRPLLTDRDPEADLIHIGSLTLKIIVRGPATLVRVWDRDSAVKNAFSGFKYYEVDEAYVVRAKYLRHDPPILVKRYDMIGTESEGQFLGRALFTLQGVECALEAEKDGEQLLFHFTDGTNRTTTYGGGRKFRTAIPEGDKLLLDFNITENWPCAYTPFATCPVVPKENRLPINIEAGEKKYFE
jgi:uncharacterized protein (DUF1684 family)